MAFIQSIYNHKIRMFRGIGYISFLARKYTQSSKFKIKIEGELCIEEVHPGSDRTSRSVARNQVPKHKSDI